MSNLVNDYLFKPLEESDIDLLFEWQSRPHVAWWWQEGCSRTEFESKYKQYIASDHVFPFLIYKDSKPIGYIQYYRVDKVSDEKIRRLFAKPSNVVGIDLFIGEPQYIAAGHGTKIMNLFINKIFQSLTDVEIIIVDPRPENTLAVNCFTKIGFSPIFKDKTQNEECLWMQLNRHDWMQKNSRLY